MKLLRYCFILTVLFSLPAFPIDLLVSGISTPAAVNGVYKPNGTVNGHNSWKHESQTYYIYNKVYTGDSKPYWNIDNDLDDASSMYYCQSTVDPPLGLTWSLFEGATGTASVVENSASPLIVVSGNAITISNGDVTPSFGDYTQFGSVDISSGTFVRTFTIGNSGGGPLTLTGSSPYIAISGTNASDFSVTSIPASTVASLGSTTFQITFNPSGTGNRNAVLSIANNDATKNPYTFSIQGRGFTPGNLVLSGMTTPAAANGNYIYQGVIFNFEYWKHESAGYYIYNDEYSGGRYWNIDNNTDDAACYLFSKDHNEDASPVSVLAWDTAGTLGGKGTPIITDVIPVADIDVWGDSTSIAIDDVTPSWADNTDLGSADVSAGTAVKSFKIKNIGGAALTLSGSSPYVAVSGTHSSDFSVTAIPSASIAANGFTTFQITFNPSAVGIRSASLSISSNDPDESPFNFSIQGHGFIAKNLMVSNISTPAGANGKYLHQGVIFGYQYWKHESAAYYMYNDVYSGSRYWNIDNNTDDAKSYFFSKDHSEDASLSNVVAWDTSGGLGGKGTPTLIEVAPTTQTTTIVLTSNGAGTQNDISWTSGDGTKRAVFMKEGSGAITNPSNNTTYSSSVNWSAKGTQLGTSGYYCIYNGSGASVSITNVVPNTQYTVQAFEYNNSAGNEQYFTATASGNPNNQTTLPVEYTSFTASATKSSTTLSWNTATEVNNFGFEVEKRAVSNGQGGVVSDQWKKIGFVSGNGTSNTPHSYSFKDEKISRGTYAYRLKQTDNSGAFKYSQETEVTIAAPKNFALSQNYPNPFNPSTVISYELPDGGTPHVVSLRVYDVMGREVASLVNETKEAGFYEVKFDASGLASGLYFYRLQTGNFTAVKKLIFMK
jgi:hypothetical protein